jgi:asparagine synthase (glutamine-hydrolysing)
MCGITGIYAYHNAASAIDRRELVRIRDHMAARGPDGKGTWVSDDSRVGFGHRRLSIIDISEAGAQPMVSADGRLVVTFNGEIYNYKALRTELEAKGCLFRTQSDTEVLLHLYAEKGAAMVHDLRGMFAFGLWDAARRTLLLARDAYGIKPLYYADDSWTVRFASQVKALLAGGNLSLMPEPAGLVGFYLWGSVPEPFTTYKDIRSVPAGSYVLVDRAGAGTPVRYQSIAAVYCEAEQRARRQALSAQQQRDEIREAVLDSVRHHLVADVPVGAFLSAGIDSGAVVGLMRDAGQSEIQTVTLAFEEFQGHADDEAPLAAEVARLYGTRHTTRVVTEQEFRTDLPRVLEAMDQPTIDGINTWFVSKAAREVGLKVAVSGLGGDELFGGYPSFADVPRCVRWLAAPARVPLAGRLARQLLTWASPQRLNPKCAGLLELGGTTAGAYLLRRGLFMPWELEQLLDGDLVQEGLRRLRALAHIEAHLEARPRSTFAQIATLESSLYMRNQLLRDTDWAGMAHGLEVRVPLVDTVLLRAMAPVTTAARGEALKARLATSPRTPLPVPVITRKKTGFTTPVGAWLHSTPQPRRTGRVPSLVTANSHWSRRWAYAVAAV